jgi:plasmid stabilization system protein ParE
VKSYRLTPKAKEDLFEIWAYIAANGLQAADRIEAELIQACGKLADRPHLGHPRRDLTDKPVRFFAVRSTYLIVYDPIADPIVVLRLLHGARDVQEEIER